MKKFLLLLAMVFLALGLTGCNSKVISEGKKININVYNKENKLIYNSKITTEEKELSDAIDNIKDLEVVFEDSNYGKFITSMEGIKQGDNYYWSYYINSKYATIGVSSCVVEDDAVYDFHIEKFE